MYNQSEEIIVEDLNMFKGELNIHDERGFDIIKLDINEVSL